METDACSVYTSTPLAFFFGLTSFDMSARNTPFSLVFPSILPLPSFDLMVTEAPSTGVRLLPAMSATAMPISLGFAMTISVTGLFDSAAKAFSGV